MIIQKILDILFLFVKKENSLILKLNNIWLLNYNKINSSHYNGGINGFLELEKWLIISDVNGIITWWKKSNF